MDAVEYARCVGALKHGKRLSDGVYVHVDLLAELPEALARSVEDARTLANLNREAFDVVRFPLRGQRLSLLAYPAFFDDAFPSLAASWTVDLRSRTVALRRYETRENPPILHRKELLLPPNHPRRAEFEGLTAQAELRGLFSDSKTIGTRRAWEGRLRRLGLTVRGHDLIEEKKHAATPHDEAKEVEVHRHRTALQRYSLSAPMQSLWRHGLLQGSSVFDYGCGRGDDLRILQQLGIESSGWDPHFAASGRRAEADVVNIGYVINVIEDPAERRDALLGAYGLARKALAVAALIGGRTAYEQYRLFRDGVLTSRGTFQKYFTQQELREYIEAVLGREPVPVAPGVFFVFRADEDEQRFLAARQTLARCQATLQRAERDRSRPPTKWDQHADLLEDFWSRCLELGRCPKDHEYVRMPELRGNLGTPQTALRRLAEQRGEDSLAVARQARMGDLLVYLALNLFERRRSSAHLPDQVRRDIAAFWGSFATAKQEASRLLFSIGKPEVIRDACRNAAEAGIGHLDADHSLQLLTPLVARLPPVLRIYVGAASRLYGEVESADIVKIHIQSGKLTLLTYDDFDGRPLPRLLERVKVNMREQDVRFFAYGDDQPVQLLYFKSRYLPADHEMAEQQRDFDKALSQLGLDLSGYGPPQEQLEAHLRDRCRLRVDGFTLKPVQA